MVEDNGEQNTKFTLEVNSSKEATKIHHETVDKNNKAEDFLKNALRLLILNVGKHVPYLNGKNEMIIVRIMFCLE